MILPPEDKAPEKRKPLLSPPGDEKVASECQNFFDEAYKDRLPWEGSWLEWLAFYQGQPYVKYSPQQNKVIPDTRVAPWRRRIAENKIRTTIDQMVSMLTAEPVMLAARPASGDFDDVNKAEIASAILRYLHEDLDWSRLDIIVRTWKAIIGHCGIEVEWDPSVGPFDAVPALGPDGTMGPLVDPETGEIVRKARGRMRLNFLTPFEMLWDPVASSPRNARYCIIPGVMDPKEAERRFGIPLAPETGRVSTGGSAKGQMGWLLRRVRAIFGPKRDAADTWGAQSSAGVDFQKLYFAPDEDNPGGRYIIKVGPKVVYDDVSPTEGVFPFPVVTFYHREHGKRPYGDGVVQDLIDLQREWNKTKSWMSEYRDLMQKGKILAPRECGIDRDAFTTEHGEVIEYDVLGANGATPSIIYPQPMPSSIFQSLGQMKADIDYTAGIYDASRGDAPTGAGASGKSLAFQKEQNTQRLQTVIRQDRKSWAEVGSLCLFFAGKHWTDGDVIRTVGRYYEPMLVDFRKSDFAEKWDVVVENDNALPLERVNRLNMLSQMFQQGGIMDPGTPMEKRRQFLSLARFGDLQGLIETENRDESKARRQFRLCLMGQPQQAAYFDDHATHRRVLTDLMKSIEFEEALPQTKELVFELDRQHATYLTGTQPMDPQGRPLPPGAVPPTQLGEMGRALMSPPPKGSPPAARPVQA